MLRVLPFREMLTPTHFSMYLYSCLIHRPAPEGPYIVVKAYASGQLLALLHGIYPQEASKCSSTINTTVVGSSRPLSCPNLQLTNSNKRA